MRLKKTITGACCSIAMICAEGSEIWRDPTVFRVNEEPAHAEFTLHDSLEDALKPLDLSNPWNSSSYMSLNGTWDFNWYGEIGAAPADWYQPDSAIKGWDAIPVPGTWQSYGFDRLYYLNTKMPFEYDWANNANPRPEFTKNKIEKSKETGFIPDAAQTVGCYRKWVELSAEQLVARVVLRIGAAESGLQVYVNGVDVGYSQDCALPAEFEISTYLRPGKNLIALKLYHWTDGSYMEVQDMVRFAGIYRDVFLRFEPTQRLRDIHFMGMPDKTLRSIVTTCSVAVANDGKTEMHGANVRFALVSEGSTEPVKEWMSVVDAVPVGSEKVVSCTLNLKGLKLWSPDQPNLYTLVATLVDGAGESVQIARIDTGFRRFEEINGNLHLNGKRFFVRGVNRHDHHCRLGKVIPLETMIRDVELMKQNNINTVRTSHYPNDERWHYLCNRYGMALIDEANVECHAFEDIPGDRPQWIPAAVDRMEAMVQRDKNHPSVFMWSLGNESNYGWVGSFEAMYERTKQIDPTRLIMCERGNSNRTKKAHLDKPDTISPMYGTLSKMQNYLKNRDKDKRPFFMCEYRHAMGNAVGALKDVWDVVYASEENGLNGGCIWDWTDQGVEAKSEDGEIYYQYGGDWNDPENRGNFSCNGLLLSDQSPTPKLAEVKKCYEPIMVKPVSLEKGEFEVHNRMNQTALDFVSVRWTLRENGVVVQQGSVPGLATAADGKEHFTVPFDASKLAADKEYFLRIAFKTVRETRWAPKGHEVTFSEFKLGGSYAERLTEANSVPNVVTSKEEIAVSADNGVVIVFDRKNGRPVSIKAGAQELLAESTRDYFFDHTTAWIDNYWRQNKGLKLADYKKLELDDLVRVGDAELSVCEEGARAVITVKNRFMSPKDAGFEETQTWRIDGAGRMEVTVHVAPSGQLKPDVWIPRIGLRLPLAPELNQVSYYGLGPHANYVDRSTGAWMGIHSAPVMNQYVPYVRPQDHGNREAVRWFEVKNLVGYGLKVIAPEPLAMSALPYTQMELKAAMHTIDLPEQPTATELRIAAKVSGLGNGSCGPATEKKYRANAAAVEYRFILVPILPKDM